MQNLCLIQAAACKSIEPLKLKEKLIGAMAMNAVEWSHG